MIISSIQNKQPEITKLIIILKSKQFHDENLGSIQQISKGN